MGTTTSFTVNGTAEGASGNTGVTEIIPHNPDNPGDEYYLQQSEVSSEGDEGGVQNWRMYEMSESAVELPDTDEKNPLMPVWIVTALCLFIGGVIYRILKFKFDMGESLHVFFK